MKCIKFQRIFSKDERLTVCYKRDGIKARKKKTDSQCVKCLTVEYLSRFDKF